MKKDFKPVYVRGTETGKGVIEALEAYGGINNCNYNGTDCDSIYFIMPDNYICSASINSAYASYVMATAEEVKHLRWRAEKGSPYYMVDDTSKVTKLFDYRDNGDEKLYECGNYFRTEAEAKEIAEKIKKILLPD